MAKKNIISRYITVFKTKEDAQNALNWLIAKSTMQKLI